ncbi:hypothetical protein [Paenibacillus thiaminolyticus]|uniref:Uncharacterized protein n=1 Tax=Paenibacillus thiaminolyticus TaxID=49283 RepID=A0A3A3H1Q0_PANTH|nr:hypothetical protein [Paenibacillus thiaminolyticus]RJG22821.1 hypothetical protein DQX05_16465 [Paenibacillus thiaminolyticus]
MIQFRPDFRTASGESQDVLFKGAYAGEFIWLYRERERLQGIFIMDGTDVQERHRSAIEEQVERYVRHTADALGVADLEVVFVTGQVQRIVTNDDAAEYRAEAPGQQAEPFGISPEDGREIAPDGEDMTEGADDRIHVILARDDGSALLYDIYRDQNGSLPVGEATISTDGPEMSGYIDFRVPGTGADRACIGQELACQLAKDKQVQSLHLTMMFHNEMIDELLVDCASDGQG